MLVMYTLNNSVSLKLPTTSYVKLIDVWLLFGLVLPFFITILLILIEHIPEDNDNAVIADSVKTISSFSAKQSLMHLNTFARFYLPILESAFLLIYSLVAFYAWKNIM